MRAQWKGHLRLSLVTIAVELHSASETSSRLELHQIDRKTGKRIRYEKVVPGKGKVDEANMVRGFELDSGENVILLPEELDRIKLETKHTIDLVQFANQSDVDPRYFEKPYYLVPQDDVSAEGYAVIRDALRESKKIGIGQMTVRGKESLVAVKACGPGLLLETLRYADEIKNSDKVFDELPHSKPDKEMVDLAKELIDRKSGPFKPEAFTDHYGDALKALVAEKKKTGRVTEAEDDAPAKAKSNVIDLMQALRDSVGKKAAAKASEPNTAAAKKAAPPKKRARK